MSTEPATRVLITGGSGFIGTNLVEHYAARSSALLNIDHARPRNAEHMRWWKELDIRDAAALCAAVTDFSPHVILHMAARADLEGRTVADYDANTRGVENMIEAARAAPALHRIVFASSMLVCRLGHRPSSATDFSPATVYGESKVQSELIVREKAAGLPWTIVRPTSIWGPWFDVPYKRFFEAVARNMYVHPRGRRVLRSYGFVLNAVHQIAAIAHSGRERVDGRTFYVADYEPTDVYQWSRLIAAEFGVHSPREAPFALFALAARAGDVLQRLGYADPPLTSFRLQNITTESVYDLADVREIAGSLPYSLAEATKVTAAWIRARTARRD